MSETAFLVDLLFRILNLLILAVVVFIAFRRYALASIQNAIRKRAEAIKLLKERRKTLLAQQESTEKEAQQQELEARRLLGTVQTWRERVAHEHGLRKQLQSQYYQDAVERIRRQQEFWCVQEQQQLVVPEALSRAYIQLHEHFSDKKAQKNYVSNIMSYCDKVRS